MYKRSGYPAGNSLCPLKFLKKFWRPVCPRLPAQFAIDTAVLKPFRRKSHCTLSLSVQMTIAKKATRSRGNNSKESRNKRRVTGRSRANLTLTKKLKGKSQDNLKRTKPDLAKYFVEVEGMAKLGLKARASPGYDRLDDDVFGDYLDWWSQRLEWDLLCCGFANGDKMASNIAMLGRKAFQAAFEFVRARDEWRELVVCLAFS